MTAAIAMYIFLLSNLTRRAAHTLAVLSLLTSSAPLLALALTTHFLTVALTCSRYLPIPLLECHPSPPWYRSYSALTKADT